eukprot:gnl/Spiro4/25602_TR12749_c0_g1_i1.p1 gnl/Spiro4/25602_TR12749_c0_g1~~gnl/Spiro4/25602_TR12749_c0_g1_i1.p1  ORF type:complete len:256 (-),score=62.47 gnl/Spiro4/25602_TR12749_c0_g1_i1:123-854(-)
MATPRLVVITGASSGIGQAAARIFSAAGFPLLLLARRVALMEAMNLPNAMCTACDVSNLAELQRAIAAAEERFGPTDLLINNAGLMQLGEVQTQNPDEWKNMIDVNVVAVANGCRVVLPGMHARKRGTIITVSSIAGHKSFPNHAVYCATKFALHGMLETIRKESAADGIRVCIISPGVVQTELLGHTTDSSIVSNYETWKAGELQGQPLAPEDIGNAMLYVYNAPPRMCIRDMVIGPTFQSD